MRNNKNLVIVSFIAFITIIQTLLVCLRLKECIMISWAVIFLPTIVIAGFFVLLFLLAIIAYIIGCLKKKGD